MRRRSNVLGEFAGRMLMRFDPSSAIGRSKRCSLMRETSAPIRPVVKPCQCYPTLNNCGFRHTFTAHTGNDAVPVSVCSYKICLLYTSDAADDLLCVDLG